MSSLNAFVHALRAYNRNRRAHKEEPEVPYLRYVLAADDVCLHVGASDGRHSYTMARDAPRARIHAFEPSRFTFGVLQRVMRWHGLSDRVTAVNAAAGDAPGELMLVTPRKTSGRMGRALAFTAAAAPEGQARPDIDTAGVAVQPTPVIVLDDWCAAHGVGRVDFIRMDIEGSEAAALKGALGIIERDHPNALVEIHPAMLKARFGADAQGVVDLFLTRGYRMFELEGDQLVERRDARPDLPWKDYFFLHPSRLDRLPEGPFKTLMA